MFFRYVNRQNMNSTSLLVYIEFLIKTVHPLFRYRLRHWHVSTQWNQAFFLRELKFNVKRKKEKMGRYGRAYTISNVILAIYVTVFCVMKRNEIKQCWHGDCRNFASAKLIDLGDPETNAGPTSEPPTALPPAVSSFIKIKPILIIIIYRLKQK